MRIKFVLVISCLFAVIQLQAQNTMEGLYINEKYENDFFCIRGDTIFFRYSNNDAFGTSSLFYGAYSFNKRKLKLKNNDAINLTSSVKEENRNDSLVKIQMFYLNNAPISFTSIVFSTTEIEKVYHPNNKEALFLFDKKDLENLLGKKVKINISTISFYTEQIVNLELGKSYYIKSTVPKEISFFISNHKKGIKYKIDNKKGIIKFWDHEFKKVGDCEYCKEKLFNLE